MSSINTLKQWLDESQYTVIFSGAGMSTESGLPDFRSASSGLWNNIDPLKLASTNAMINNREDFVSFYRYRVEQLQKCCPNAGHAIIAEWENKGKVNAVITQNVDGFHHASGSREVYELHGTLRTSHCSGCRAVYPISRFMETELPCECGGFIRPSVLLFGEILSEEALLKASKATTKAELFIVLGSSLSVSPANYFAIDAKDSGAKLVIINMEPTEMDDIADLVNHNRKIGEVLRELN
ncbi:NAD-dependent deacylase [Bacillus sp. T33-2]|uniref:NAD-dependent deacylase n=1 Tax=Bacillus sp. T33-2 TaxID=2054168 RepID=UPI000C789951|nr:NAD-dependent deacylase [Bacillus sp. T33-2]PLR98484.1 NAD-dependent protein deacylase [Bacillus sp. T33-2]